MKRAIKFSMDLLFVIIVSAVIIISIIIAGAVTFIVFIPIYIASGLIFIVEYIKNYYLYKKNKLFERED